MKHLSTHAKVIHIVSFIVILLIAAVSEYFIIRNERSVAALTAGQVFPSIAVLSAAERQLSLNELIRNNTILVVFSTRCTHCLDEIKFWNAVFPHLNDSCSVAALSVDNVMNTVAFVKEYAITLPVFTFVTTDAIDSLHIRSVPMIFFIDGSRILRRVIVGNQEKGTVARMISEFLQSQDPEQAKER